MRPNFMAGHPLGSKQSNKTVKGHNWKPNKQDLREQALLARVLAEPPQTISERVWDSMCGGTSVGEYRGTQQAADGRKDEVDG